MHGDTKFDDRTELASLFGPIQHIGYVVSDLDSTIRAWQQAVGVGPFVVFRGMNPFHRLKYRGKPSENIVISVAFARSGAYQIELIQQHNNTPSIYTEALAASNHGPHHYAFVTSEYDAACKHARGIGMEAILETGDVGTERMTYFGFAGIGGFIAELIELSPATRENDENIASLLADAGSDVAVIEAGGH